MLWDKNKLKNCTSGFVFFVMWGTIELVWLVADSTKGSKQKTGWARGFRGKALCVCRGISHLGWRDVLDRLTKEQIEHLTMVVMWEFEMDEGLFHPHQKSIEELAHKKEAQLHKELRKVLVSKEHLLQIGAVEFNISLFTSLAKFKTDVADLITPLRVWGDNLSLS
jgi:hypothetical protein